MYKYKSENELSTFHFHDHVVIKTTTKGNASIWFLSRIDIMPTNSCSPFEVLKAAENVMLTFNDCVYSNARKHYGIINSVPVTRKVEDSRVKHINSIIESIPLMSGNEVNKNEGIFEIFREDYLMTFNVSFSSVVVEWNEFVDVF